MLSVSALTQGVSVASARFRVVQYIEPLRQYGIIINNLPATHGSYPPAGFFPRCRWLPSTLIDAAKRVRYSNRATLRFLQRPLVSTLLTLEPWLSQPYVLDVDDAIFLQDRSRMFDRVARRAQLTICGNNFLANHYDSFGATVVVLPTAVDTERFVPANSPPLQPVIGWSGSSSGFNYLYEIEDALCVVLKKNPNAVFQVVADQPPDFKKLPTNQVQFKRWNAATEVALLQEFTVGLMPLIDNTWARGKCSFKMLTYMAAGLPVIVSPVGMNAEILALANCGLAPVNHDEWVDALDLLLHDSSMASYMGKIGRATVERYFSRSVIAPKLAELLHRASC